MEVKIPEELKGGVARVKRHLQDNKRTYLVGAGCLAAGYLLRAKSGPDVVQMFTDSTDNIATVINRSKNVDVIIKYVNQRGYVANAVVCLETGEKWASQIEAAVAKGISATNLSQHLNGKQDSVSGLHFERI